MAGNCMNIFGPYYLISALPILKFEPELVISFKKLWDLLLHEDKNLQELAGAVLLRKDLINLEKIYHGEVPLNEGRYSNKELALILQKPSLAKEYFPAKVSDYLEENIDNIKDAEAFWRKYYSHIWRMAKKHQSNLKKYLHWEFRLNTALYEYRIEMLNKQETMSRVSEYDYKLIERYKSIEDPLEAEKTLDQMRWRRIARIAEPYSFHRDEIVVYALHLIIVDRWWNISQTKGNLFAKVTND
jgi:ABC-type multidrug transport system fused ATPase/permease subunit